MKKLVVYIHGKGGNAEEAEGYKPLFPDSDVVGFDYRAQNPWEAQSEFKNYFQLKGEGYDSVILIANSIGAFFALSALSDERIDRAFLISPIVNMEKLIRDMMGWANVSEEELFKRKEIPTAFGERLSWEYLRYVREHPIGWKIPTHVLYGEKDNLTSLDTVSEFAQKSGATLTVMRGGEHWFHTAEQTAFLYDWIRKAMG